MFCLSCSAKSIFFNPRDHRIDILFYGPHFPMDYFFLRALISEWISKDIYVAPMQAWAHMNHKIEKTSLSKPECIQKRQMLLPLSLSFLVTYLELNAISRAKITDLLSCRPEQQMQTKAFLAAPEQPLDPKCLSLPWVVIITLFSIKKYI